ncbi:hypothetical protein RRG08_058580 [Elysia crispata]|uniref:Uncharacterized protein n=1 Tax=Elysia crispata TaxID=231223 RepID=A0AAE1E6M3_9GAST|nr:hypothetical protein RRG08_058580 [Elysia crispata]
MFQCPVEVTSREKPSLQGPITVMVSSRPFTHTHGSRDGKPRGECCSYPLVMIIQARTDIRWSGTLLIY